MRRSLFISSNLFISSKNPMLLDNESMALGWGEVTASINIPGNLKFNDKERSFLAACAGYSRFVYNYGLNMVNGTKGMTKVNKRGQQVNFSYNERIDQAKKVWLYRPGYGKSVCQ